MPDGRTHRRGRASLACFSIDEDILNEKGGIRLLQNKVKQEQCQQRRRSDGEFMKAASQEKGTLAEM